ncbi:MAG TPA: MFS transporter [Candidatus Dormibacteraeota bacterium]|nr:MFS transporter [Candidatus Dormibacteraeota bacterium]
MTVSARVHEPRWQRLIAVLGTEPAPLRSMASRPWAPWQVVATVCVGGFMGQLDASIVTVALPSLQSGLSAGVAAVEWVALSYLLVLVALVTVVGRIADMVGRKLLYIYGFGVFVAGSALCAAAPDLGILLVARVVQAVGAAMLQANSVALIACAMPASRLGRGIGVHGVSQAVGLALGPLAGGALLSLGGWRLIFLVNVPAGIAGMLLGWFLLPRTTGLCRRAAFDIPGAGLLVVAAAGVMGALSLARSGGIGAPVVPGLAFLAVVSGVLLVRRERRVAHPVVDLALFRTPAFSAGVLSGLLASLVMFGVLFAVPFHLELERHLGPAQAGLTVAALPLALGLVAPLAARAAEVAGSRAVTTAGMLLAAAGLLALGVAHGGAALVVELAVIGAGLGAFTPANNAAVMASAPGEQVGVASGLVNMTRGLGTALGVATAALVDGIGDSLAAVAFVLAVIAALAAAVGSARGRPAGATRQRAGEASMPAPR